MATKKEEKDVKNMEDANKEANVGMKKSDPKIHSNIDDMADYSETNEAEKRKGMMARDDKKKKLGLFERLEIKRDDDEDVMETQIMSNDLAEGESRSTSAVRYNPTLDYGLSDDQIAQRNADGLTNLNTKKFSKSYKQIFLSNILTFFNIVCISVAIALIYVQSWGDLSFLAIMVINTVIGIYQEIKAKHTIDKLTIVTAPTATVVRQGLVKEIAVNDLVLDDIMKLRNGKQISADCIIKEGNIEVNESLLTGESVAIKKTVGDKLYAGSFITAGTCFAQVERVGKDCYIQKLQAKAKKYTKPKSELLRSIKLITTIIAFILVPIGSIVAYTNYTTSIKAVKDPTFGTTGSLVVYGIEKSNNEVEIGKINSVNSELDTVVSLNNIETATNDIRSIKISYVKKVNGNISISSISVYGAKTEGENNDYLPDYDNILFSWTAEDHKKVNEYKSFNQRSYATEYLDGSIKLDESSDNIITNDLSTSTNKVYIRLVLQSRGYGYDATEQETNEMKSEVVRLTVTKTAGSIIGMIPAGMFLLVTVALAVSVMKLAKSKTLVQELYCIEMLARVDCICLDKTGTITDGTMKVKEIIEVSSSKSPNDVDLDTIMGSLLGALNDNNQTSIALQDRFGINFEYKKQVVLPFSSSRKLSGVTFEDAGTYIIGAPEYVYQGKSKKILALVDKKASMGYRVLMLTKSDKPIVGEKIPQGLIPVAIFVLEDHIRDTAPATIKWFNENGVQVKVISGDNPATVAEIAGRVGIKNADDYISLEGLSAKEVEIIATEYTVFGRVTPDQKAILVKTLKRAGKTVAMTGDGVNDILAMKEADCSVAMASGSEAARNIAHLVLLDSNFANMPKVVLEGRRVINNIQRSSSLYLMKTFFTMAITLLSILATNIFTEGYPFVTKQFMMLEMFAIGIPSFVIALQPNKNKITGSFLGNVLSSCVTQAVCLFLPILCIYLVKSAGFELINLSNSYELSALCVIALTYTGLIVLVDVCRPLNTLRSVLCIIVFTIVTIIISLPSIAEVFGIYVKLTEINITNLFFVSTIVLAMVPLSRLFHDIIYTTKQKKINNELEENNIFNTNE